MIDTKKQTKETYGKSFVYRVCGTLRARVREKKKMYNLRLLY